MVHLFLFVSYFLYCGHLVKVFPLYSILYRYILVRFNFFVRLDENDTEKRKTC